jgi:hypothetical protein
MTRTTPPRPLDLEELFPALTRYARTATLLHPREGIPGVEDSSVGGPLLWPAAEPWPTCSEHDSTEPDDTTVEQIPLLAIAQLYARDIADLPTLLGTDVLQVLWCPFDHGKADGYAPATRLFWRDSSTVDRSTLLSEPPVPDEVEYDDYVPSPCVLHPEKVIEYPLAIQLFEVLDAPLCRQIAEWCQGQDPDSGREIDDTIPYDYARSYDKIASTSKWKVGGWPFWGSIDPFPVTCECGATMTPLLQIGSGEWFSDVGYWTPIEDLETARGRAPETRSFGNPPEIYLPDGLRLHVYLCPDNADHLRRQLLA